MSRPPRPGEGVGICDFSGFKVPLGDLVRNWDGAMVDKRFADKRNPQDFVRGIRDNQRLPFTRPEPPDVFETSLPTLATAGATYHAVYSTERLLPRYRGALARGIDNTGGGAVDLGLDATGISSSEIAALTGSGTSVAIDKFYDQAGSSRDLSQTTSARRPVMRSDGLVGGKMALLIDGIPAGAWKFMTATHSLARTSLTYFLVFDPSYSIKTQIHASWQTGSTIDFGTSTDQLSNHGMLQVQRGGAQTNIARYMSSSPQVLVVRSGASGVQVFLDGTKRTPGASASAKALTEFYLGATNTNTDYNGNERVMAIVVVDGDLSDADVSSVSAMLSGHFNLPSPTRNLLLSGDSIMQGAGVTWTYNINWFLRPLISSDWRIYNFGLAGKTLAGIFVDRADYDGQLDAQVGIDGAITQAGINDIDAAFDGTTLHDNALTWYIDYLKNTIGVPKVGVSTLLPQTLQTPQEAQRNIYNGLVRADKGGADTLIDIAADVTMGTYPTSPNDPTLYGDKIHPTTHGEELLTPYYADAINSW